MKDDGIFHLAPLSLYPAAPEELAIAWRRTFARLGYAGGGDVYWVSQNQDSILFILKTLRTKTSWTIKGGQSEVPFQFT